jgi:hypothetical protein
MKDTDRKLLEDDGWEIECESPFEIRCEESFATNQAARIILNSLREPDLRDLFVVSMPNIEMQFFLDEDGTVLAAWSANDAKYRKEYMEPLFRRLNIRVVEAKPRDKRFFKAILEEIKAVGYNENDM